MLERVVRTNLRYNMFARGHRIGVAVSGGADSICLLEVLRELAPAWNLHLEILHLNHLLRGAESDADEDFVRDLAALYACPFHLERVDVRQAAQGRNLECAARELRLHFFLRVKQQASLDRIATGHTRNDQAETVLFRILRGAGISGLAGILPLTAEGLIRPLLDLERGEIEEWLRGRGISWRQDSTNEDRSLVRNRIRHSALPLLEGQFNPQVRLALARLATSAFEEENYWSKVLDDCWAPLSEAPGVLELSAGATASAPPALARRLIRRAIQRVTGSAQSGEFGHVEQVLNLVRRSAGSGRLDMTGVSVRRSFDRLRFEVRQADATAWEYAVEAPGEWTMPSGGSIRIGAIEKDVVPGAGTSDQCFYNKGMHWLDGERITFPLTLRGWRPGDLFQPPGRAQPVKVKELFQRARVPSWQRKDWPVILSAGQVAWSRKFGTAEWAAPGAQTRRLIKIMEIKENTPETEPK